MIVNIISKPVNINFKHADINFLAVARRLSEKRACVVVFLELDESFFVTFRTVLETYMKLCVAEPGFFRKTLCPQNGPKVGLFIEKFGNYFFLNLVFNESSYYLPCSCTKTTSEENMIFEWAKMFLANQIAGFLNQLYMQNKCLKWSDPLYVNTFKLKVDL